MTVLEQYELFRRRGYFSSDPAHKQHINNFFQTWALPEYKDLLPLPEYAFWNSEDEWYEIYFTGTKAYIILEDNCVDLRLLTTGHKEFSSHRDFFNFCKHTPDSLK